MSGLPCVVLRPQTLADAERVIGWRSLPEVQAGLFSEGAPTPEEHRKWLEGLGDDRREYIILAGVQRRPVGTAGLSGISRVHSLAEYGVLIGERDCWGKGYAAAASHELLRIAFQDLKLHRVFLRVLEDNARAIRLYLRLGFVREGVLRGHVRKGGMPRNVVVMGMLASEWRPPA